MSNAVLNLLASLKESHPDQTPLLDAIASVYTLTSIQKNVIDWTYMVYPPGHYASPVPSLAEMQNIDPAYFTHDADMELSVKLHAERQCALFQELSAFYDAFPYVAGHNAQAWPLRYFEPNDWFGLLDAFCLYGLMRKFRPRRIIEIGSGFSSCVMLDTNQLFMNNEATLCFVEPFPESRLLQIIKDTDAGHCEIAKAFVQQVQLQSFSLLQENDILFIDSSHVGKAGSDVLFLLHRVLPMLNSGVLVHFHDIPYPFEFTLEHYKTGGEPWNEMYFLRTFLQYNSQFEILLFSDWLYKKQKALLAQCTPAMAGGGSLWLRKV